MSMKRLMIATQAGAIAALMGTAAFAQVSVETPEGTTATIPEAALEGQAPVATTDETGYELLAQSANDEVIISSLEGQGFSNIVIEREGTTLTVTAERDGTPLELIYSTATGRLISIDGVPVGPTEGDFVVIDTPAEEAAAGAAPVDTVGHGEQGIPGETDGREPDNDGGADLSDPGAEDGEDSAETDGVADTDGGDS